jgi:hypothetical protein
MKTQVQQQSYRILSDLKNENDPIVIEYDPGKFKIILRQFGIIE